MAYSGSDKGRLLAAAGILSIIGGVLEIIGGGIAVAMMMQDVKLGPLVPILPIPFIPGSEIWITYVQNRFVNVAIIVMVLGAMAIVGGISALRKKRFGLSLAGAICILPTVLLGILAVIFIALGKREFEAIKG
jgi:hypothetical protein